MCGSCDYGDMGEVNELFGALYRLNYVIKYEKTFNDILKQLRQDACFTPSLRKYSIKLDKFTQDWMNQISGYDIMEGRHGGYGPPPYDINTMTWEQLQEAVAKQEMEDQKKRDEASTMQPLFSRLYNKQSHIRKRLPCFHL